ncbi:Uncharacterized protein Rs2_04695 [Raphanus sativus]|nr:Uncharacterized protein Rs2_04695 [Raphanus sativus]
MSTPPCPSPEAYKVERILRISSSGVVVPQSAFDALRLGGGCGPRAVPEVAKEIENQFVKAAESRSEIAKLLEVGKHPYGRKHAASKLLHGVTPFTSVSEPPTFADIEDGLASRSRNLSSSLHKLHLWEKKRYHEVKAEELGD